MSKFSELNEGSPYDNNKEVQKGISLSKDSKKIYDQLKEVKTTGNPELDSVFKEATKAAYNLQKILGDYFW